MTSSFANAGLVAQWLMICWLFTIAVVGALVATIVRSTFKDTAPADRRVLIDSLAELIRALSGWLPWGAPKPKRHPPDHIAGRAPDGIEASPTPAASSSTELR